MKWKNHGHYRQRRLANASKGKHFWHKRFAWYPVSIPETKHDSVVVPAHYVWLEPYDAVKFDRDIYHASGTVPRDTANNTLIGEGWHYRDHADGTKPTGENLPSEYSVSPSFVMHYTYNRRFKTIMMCLLGIGGFTLARGLIALLAMN